MFLPFKFLIIYLQQRAFRSRSYISCVFVCVWTHRNFLHLSLTASLTSKYQFNIKGRVSAHTSVSSHIHSTFNVCTHFFPYTRYLKEKEFFGFFYFFFLFNVKWYKHSSCTLCEQCRTEGKLLLFYVPASPLTHDCFWHRMCEPKVWEGWRRHRPAPGRLPVWAPVRTEWNL